MTGQDRLARLLEELAEEFPDHRIILKSESRFQKLLHRVLVVVTLGGNREYLTGYHTTIGRRIYVTPDWEQMARDRRYAVLMHERVHMRQFRRFTFVGMMLLYLLVPLPAGLAWFRAHFEKAAYAESIRATAEIHGFERARAPEYRQHIIDQFTGPSYGWMWPFRRSMERWYDRVLADIQAA